MSHTIHYWHGIHVDDIADGEIHQKIFDKLLNGHYQGADLDLKKQGKKGSYPIFGVRINNSDRLLFTTIEVDGKPYLKSLETVLNHDYQKSRFLKPGVLQNYLEQNKDIIAQQIRNGENVISATPVQVADKSPQSDIEALDENDFDFPIKYGQQYIVLNTEQQEVLNATLPVVVSGAPGSGKSCVAISLLKQCQENESEKEELRPLLYVTQSKKLVEEMQNIWADLAKDGRRPEVQFKSIEELFTEIATDPEDKRTLVDDGDFKIWLEKHISSQQSLRKVKPKDFPSVDFFKQKDLIYQEFRLMSGLSPEEYRMLGGKQCHFQAAVEKDWLLKAFNAYQDYLNKNKLLHPSFPFNKSSLYSTIVVDEAQDLSTGQLQNLLQLSTNSQICYLMDSHQSLLDELSQRSFLIRWVREKNYQLNHITLPFSYRCPPNITDIANGIIKIKTDLTGGLTDKYEAPKIESSPHHEEAGSVRWYNKFSEEEKEYFINAAKSKTVAIVTPAEHKEEARKLFPTTGLIFTPEEIKGQEYPIIIAYRPFDTPIFKEANTILDKKLKSCQIDESEGTSSSGHRAKQGQGDDKFAPPFNKTFTTFTRAMNELIIFQDSFHDNKHIITPLQKKVQNQAPLSDLMQTTAPIASTKAEWEQEALKQEKIGNIEQAKAIRERWGLSSLQVEESKETHVVHVKEQTKALQGKGHGKKKTKKQKKKNKAKKNKEDKEIKVSSAATQSAAVITSTPEKQVQSLPVNYVEKFKKLTQTELIKLEFVEKLFKNFTETNLHKIFFSEKGKAPPKPEKWLFEIEMKDHPSLIAAILQDKERIKRLLDFLKNNPTIKLLPSADDLCKIHDKSRPLLWELCAEKERVKLLELLLTYNESLAIHFSATDLYSFEERPNRYQNVSPLYWLSTSPEGRKILSGFLASNPNLVRGITGDDLTRYRPKEAEVYENTSPLYWLADEEDGIKILAGLIIDHPHLAKEITADSLCRLRTAKAGKDENCSVLYSLATNFDGTSLLEKLLKFNPKLAEEITHQALYTILTASNKSAFDSLLGSPHGRAILLTLFNANPELATHITGNMLCRMDLSYINNQEIIPPLFWLTTIPEGLKIFKILLEKNPNLAKEITHEALCHPRSNLAGPNENTTPLYGLCKSGVELLEKLLENNAELAKTITADDLCRFKPAPTNHQNASPLYWLSTSQKGRKILNFLVQENPALAEQITAEALCRPLTKSLYSLENTSPLYALVNFTEGRTFLYTLLENNSAIAKGITGEALCRLRNSEAGFYKNSSVLYTLSSCLEGQALLSHLLAKNSRLYKEITAEALYTRIGPEREEMQNTSVFYWLTTTNEGLNILHTLLIDNPKLIEKITTKDLCSHRDNKAGKHENYSSLAFLCKTPKGREVLKFLLENKPDLAKGITKEVLKRPLYIIDEFDGSKTVSGSPEYWLSHSDDGKEIIALLPALKNQKYAYSGTFFMPETPKFREELNEECSVDTEPRDK